MATAIARRPAGGHPCWTTGYGLRHCEGYRVFGPQVRGGYVEEVRLDEFDDVRAIVVGGTRRRVVPATAIESVDVDAEVVHLKGTTR